MQCSNCGTNNSKNASFCSECGLSLDHKAVKKPSHISTPVYSSPSKLSAPQQALKGVSRFIKVVFYLFYIAMIVLVPAVVWNISENRVCQGSYLEGNVVCANTGNGLVVFRNVFFAIALTYFALEVIKSIGIYITSGTKFKDQKTFFMQAMYQNSKKKR
jgi:hypothetical protein